MRIPLKSYRELADNRDYKNILKTHFLLSPVLTVGYSLRDPDFKAIIRVKIVLGDGVELSRAR